MSYRLVCTECRQDFSSERYGAEFCGTGCRNIFNNRRSARGAILYDLLMGQRVDPERFERLHLEGRVSNALDAFILQDRNMLRKRTHKNLDDVGIDTKKWAKATPPAP